MTDKLEKELIHLRAEVERLTRALYIARKKIKRHKINEVDDDGVLLKEYTKRKRSEKQPEERCPKCNFPMSKLDLDIMHLSICDKCGHRNKPTKK